MTALATTRIAAASYRPAGLGNRFVAWLLALDAGYRNAHALAQMSDARLVDMGIDRAAAEAEFARHGGTIDLPARTEW
jgi:uncharacterized protein YjiS (DUF1127 family)